MPAQKRQTQSTHPRTIGILIVNTGTPETPKPEAVRRFLAQFLADPKVINYPRWLWLPLLHGVILRVRPRRSAQLYRRIWTEAGSPLLLGTDSLAAKIEVALTPELDLPVRVVAGMRYGEPSIPAALSQLRAHGVRRILILPLFPQYSGTTTGTILTAVFDELHTWFEVPALTIIRDYHNQPAYIRTLAENIRNHMTETSHLLFSFHGIPRSYGEAGDPYESQCQETAVLVAQALDLDFERWSLSFQSRFGPQEWLTPYTDEEFSRIGREKVSGLNVVCPGFAVDCLETLEEIAHQGAQTFQNAGGGVFNYIPALNDHPHHVDALSEIILSHLREGALWN